MLNSPDIFGNFDNSEEDDENNRNIIFNKDIGINNNEQYYPFYIPNIVGQDTHSDKDIYSKNGNNFYFDKDNFDNDNNENENENNTYNLQSKNDRTTLVKAKNKLNIKGNNPNCWTLDEINKLFDLETDIRRKIIEDIPIDEPFLNRKRNRDFTITNDTYGSMYNNNKFQIEVETTKKRGRKPKNEEGQRKHNKSSPDNIIKKIKANLFKYCKLFLNNVLSGITNTKILDLDYKYINQLKKDLDLKFIGMTLKDLFSLDISPKYQDMPHDTNKINIQKILNDNKDDTLEFIFNMTFRDWIDVFTYKKNISELLQNYNNDNNNIGIDVKTIEENMIGVHELLKELAKNNKDEYFSLFTFYLYNYELWFSSRMGRNRKQKE